MAMVNIPEEVLAAQARVRRRAEQSNPEAMEPFWKESIKTAGGGFVVLILPALLSFGIPPIALILYAATFTIVYLINKAQRAEMEKDAAILKVWGLNKP